MLLRRAPALGTDQRKATNRRNSGGSFAAAGAYVSVSLTFSVVKNSMTSPGLTSL